MSEYYGSFKIRIKPKIREDKKEKLETKLQNIVETTNRKYYDEDNKIYPTDISYTLLKELKDNLVAKGFYPHIVFNLDSCLVLINILKIPKKYAMGPNSNWSLIIGDTIE